MMRALIVALVLLCAAPANAAQLLNVAQRYVGLHERSHNAALRKLVGVNPARVPWCAYFVSAMVKKIGGKVPSANGRAISWRNTGKPVKMASARRGDIVVMRNHVTIFTKRTGTRICGIGGNQNNRVRESCYSASRVIALRRL